MDGSRMRLQLTRSLSLGVVLLVLAACGIGDSTPTQWGAPSNPGGGGGATRTYTVAWDAVNDVNVTGYRIYYNTVPFTSGGSPGHVDVGASTTAIDFQPGSYGIAAGTTLYIVVASTGAGGAESPVSLPVSVVVQ